MRRIIWITIIAGILVTWGLYTWVNPVRAAIDSFFVYAVFPTVGGAFTSMYVAVVSSPFWITYVAPWGWLISGCIFSIATMVVFWKAPSIRKKVSVPKKIYQHEPEASRPEILSQTPKVTTENLAPPKKEEKPAEPVPVEAEA